MADHELAFWLIGVLLGIIQVLLGLLLRSLYARIKALEDDSQNVAIASHVSRFNATEQAWDMWRESFVETMGKRLDSHSDEIKELTQKVTRLERNGRQ